MKIALVWAVLGGAMYAISPPGFGLHAIFVGAAMTGIFALLDTAHG